jgi:NADPH-dependent 2,4-dienoyl-CoA reductase/sulfur reductase-like enzyme
VETRDWVTGEWTLCALAGPANRQARIAADNIAGRASRFRGTQGTSVLGLFGTTVASTGEREGLRGRRPGLRLLPQACARLLSPAPRRPETHPRAAARKGIWAARSHRGSAAAAPTRPGASEKTLKRVGRPYAKIYTHGGWGVLVSGGRA